MDGKAVYQAVPEFTGRNVPVSVVAKVMGKDKQFVRQGMIHGNLPIGSVFKKEGSNQYDYYVSRSCYGNLQVLFTVARRRRALNDAGYPKKANLR